MYVSGHLFGGLGEVRGIFSEDVWGGLGDMFGRLVGWVLKGWLDSVREGCSLLVDDWFAHCLVWSMRNGVIVWGRNTYIPSSTHVCQACTIVDEQSVQRVGQQMCRVILGGRLKLSRAISGRRFGGGFEDVWRVLPYELVLFKTLKDWRML